MNIIKMLRNLVHISKFLCNQTIFLKTDIRILLSKYQTNTKYHTKTSCCTIHTSICNYVNDLEPTDKQLRPRLQLFEAIKSKDKKTFLKLIESYNEADKVKRGHVEFIYAAMKYMEEFGVQEDLEIYKKLLDVFPKGKMIPKNLIQAEFYHFARQQDCAIAVLEKMEFIGVYPDTELRDIVTNIFGKSSHVYKKLARMLYWMPKFKNLNPYLPRELPSDIRELAKLALRQMSVDKRTKIVEYDAKELEDSLDKTWIMSAQSPVQQKLIQEHSEDKALYVEGPFLVWLRRLSMTYFILRADPKIYPEVDDDPDDVSNISLYMFGERKPKVMLLRPQSVHEQEDGVIMGMCCTGTSSTDSLLSWIRFLQNSNPRLNELQVLFTLKSSPSSLVALNMNPDEKPEVDISTDTEKQNL